MRPYGQRTTPADGPRPTKSVASSHESRAGSARNRTDHSGEREKWERGSVERKESNTLHIVFHFPTTETATAAAAAAADSLQRQCSTGPEIQ